MPTTRPLIAALLAAIAPVATAAPPEQATFTGVPSNGLLNSPANALRTAVFDGGYTLGRIDYSGSITSMQSATWRSDSRILVTAPSGQTTVIVPFASGGQFSTLSFSGSFFMPVDTSPGGEWGFRFYEAVDNGGPAAVDALVTITLTLTDEPPSPPAAIDLGELATPGLSVADLAVGAGEVSWYRFTLPQVALADRRTFLDIDTAASVSDVTGSPSPFPNDTELALYDAQGTLIATDDDSGPGFTSVTTFGASGREAIGDGIPLDGRHGPLLPGVYYLAVAWNNAAFGAERWDVAGSGATTGAIHIALTTNISDDFPCAADWNGDTAVNSGDISGFLTTWLAAVIAGTGFADTNSDGTTDSADISTFLTTWISAVQSGC